MSIRRKPAFINDSEFSFLQAGCIVCLAHHDTTTSSQSCDASIPNEALGSPVIILSIQESGRRLKSQVVFAPIISFQDSPSGDSTNPHLDPDDFVEIAKGIEEEDDPAVDFLIRIKAHFQQLSEDKIPRRVLHLRAGHEMAGSSHVRTKVYRTTASMLCKYAEKMPPPRLTPNALRYLRMKIAEKMEPVGEGDGSSISLKIWTGSKRLLEVGGVVAEGSRSRAQAFAMLKRKQKVLKGWENHTWVAVVVLGLLLLVLGAVSWIASAG
ncbi:hypothetical protein DL95DRAFT_468754 [Leptodontidium sp. 2 PMI_412]|nr:hypothetical protein DL95DRAFT_468754 [Leptodontidium sp. 2 PMI_412]